MDTKCKELTVNDSDFQESSFYNMELNKTKFSNTNFSKCEFFKTLLDKINLSTCNISGIKLTNECLKGAQVNTVQAIELVELLGVEVVE